MCLGECGFIRVCAESEEATQMGQVNRSLHASMLKAADVRMGCPYVFLVIPLAHMSLPHHTRATSAHAGAWR